MSNGLQTIQKLVEKSENILILTHRGPDEMLSSSLLLKISLEDIYPKKVYLQTKQGPTVKLPRMEDIEMVNKYDSTRFDLILVTDASDMSLCADVGDNISNDIQRYISIITRPHLPTCMEKFDK